jgi:hypothetical protein
MAVLKQSDAYAYEKSREGSELGGCERAGSNKDDQVFIGLGKLDLSC